MGRKKLSEIEKAQALTKVEQGVSVIKIVANLKVSRQAAYNLIKAAKNLPKGTVPKQKLVLEENKKMSGRTDCVLKQQVLASPSSTTWLQV